MASDRQKKLVLDALLVLEKALDTTVDPSLLGWCIQNEILKEEAVIRLEHLISIGISIAEGTEQEPVEEDSAGAREMPRAIIAAAQVVIMKVSTEDPEADVSGSAMTKWSTS